MIDDTYNANPASVLAGAKVAVDMTEGEAWLILGDLGELAGDANQVHAELGVQLKKLGINRLFTLGALSANAAMAFYGNENTQMSFTNFDELKTELNKQLNLSDSIITLLVKGSRTSRMERVVDSVIQFNQPIEGNQ